MFLKYVRLFFEFLVSRSYQIIARISLGVLCTLPLEVPSLFHRPHMRKRLRLRFWLRAGAGASKLLLLLVFIPLRLGFGFFYPIWRVSFWTRQLLLFVFCTSLHFNFAPLGCSAQFSSTWLKARFKLDFSFGLAGVLVFRFLGGVCGS